eukprot:TRINITY_DN5315_c0_g1_i1.p1 TRINITY_DN5315_c0_g1~~TRINITY_DN5315_c0_g1_i1.p1  ORF type:complete len:455 (+),score=88.56 TRINITY_DN5315_c0_g1_i1:379-1743(+)
MSSEGNNSVMSEAFRSYYFQAQSFLRRVIPTAFLHSSPHDFALTAKANVQMCSVPHPLACLLGKSYNNPDTVEADVRRDFERMIWMTYRDEINPPLTGDATKLTSDAGWGCMIRTIQMILAEAYRRNVSESVLVEEWKSDDLPQKEHQTFFTKTATLDSEVGPDVLVDSRMIAAQPVVDAPAHVVDDNLNERDVILKHVVQRFLDLDEPSLAPLSIHRILQDRAPGRWYGPHEASMLAKRCVSQWENSPLSVVVCQDGAIYKSELQTPVCILIPIRLGLDTINPKYIDLLYSCLSFPLSIGIAGGKPNTSFYFVGFHGHRFFYLDPHRLQRSAKGSFKFNFDDGVDPSIRQAEEALHSSYFCSEIQSLSVEDMDPCMSVGFYCHDEKQVESFWDFAVEMSKDPFCVFSVSDVKGGRKLVSQANEALSAQMAGEDVKDEIHSDDDFILIETSNKQ